MATLPPYAAGTLADVLPAVAASLGVAAVGPAGADPFGLTPARRAVVVLIDGLGAELLARRGGHAPWLRAQAARTHRVPSGFPSTTATSMGSFGTGLPPGAHGLLGYEVLDPDSGRILNELSWEDGPVPERWQRHQTVFEQVAAAGVSVTRVGPGFFDGSGLTRAALRGGRFAAADTLMARVEATLAAVRRAPQSLVYLYWGDVDKVGHVHGCASLEWGDAVEEVDAALAYLAAQLPPDCSLTVTADHGMVDIAAERRVDLAGDAALDAGIRLWAGEPRAPQLHCHPGAAVDVLQSWQERFGSGAWVRLREEAIAEGWFGPTVEQGHRARLGEVVVAFVDDLAVVDSRVMRPELLALRGLHGSVTAAEMLVPVVHLPARRTA